MARLFKRKDDEEEKKRQQQEAEEASSSSASAPVTVGDSGAADLIKHLQNVPESKKKWKDDTPPTAQAAPAATPTPAPAPIEEPVIPEAEKPQKFGAVKTGKNTYDFSWADDWSDQQRMVARIGRELQRAAAADVPGVSRHVFRRVGWRFADGVRAG